jgi:hypothetical protein
VAASADRAQRQLNGGTAGLGDSDGRFEPQQIAAQFQKRLSLMVGKESEMADADETLGQSVLQEPPQELGGRDGHLLLLVAVRVIPPQKSHLTMGNGDDAVIRDGHAVGVAGQVAEDVLRAAERSFRINHPLATVGLIEQSAETTTGSQVGESTMELQLALSKCPAQEVQKLAPKDPAQHFYREQEVVAGADPASPIQGQAASGDHAMNMGMVQQPPTIP